MTSPLLCFVTPTGTAVTSKSTSALNVLPAAFRFSLSTSDTSRRYFLFINDCQATSGLASDCDPNQVGAPACHDERCCFDWPGTQTMMSARRVGLSGGSFLCLRNPVSVVPAA